MRIVMLSWEYPPKIVGGIARHVEEISWALAKSGVEVHVVTCEFPGAPDEEVFNDVFIHRVTPYQPTDNFVHWVHQLNAAMRDRAEALLREWSAGYKKRELILLHAHDWLAYFAGRELKHQFKLPLVATIHATEFGRNHGIHDDGQRYIHSIEWQLVYEAWRVIVCSSFMKGEVGYALSAPDDKVDIIPNGVHSEKFQFEFPADETAAFRAQFAAPEEKLILFVGRLVREKGVEVLIEALPKVRAGYHDAKLVIVGGGYRDHLVQLAEACGVARHIYFTGFLADESLLKLYKVIDVACFPSLYEPFGIVALEAMAAGVPVVVSDAGGFYEMVEPDRTGTVTWAGNRESLAWGLLRVLHDPDHARWMAEQAAKRVAADFNWKRIAAMTRSVYERVWQEYQVSDWGK